MVHTCLGELSKMSENKPPLTHELCWISVDLILFILDYGRNRGKTDSFKKPWPGLLLALPGFQTYPRPCFDCNVVEYYYTLPPNKINDRLCYVNYCELIVQAKNLNKMCKHSVTYTIHFIGFLGNLKYSW